MGRQSAPVIPEAEAQPRLSGIWAHCVRGLGANALAGQPVSHADCCTRCDYCAIFREATNRSVSGETAEPAAPMWTSVNSWRPFRTM